MKNKIFYVFVFFILAVFAFSACETSTQKNQGNYSVMQIEEEPKEENTSTEEEAIIIEEQQNDVRGLSIELISLKTDKITYTSYEKMNITAVLTSSIDVQDIQARVYGIKPYTYNFIDEQKTFIFEEGENKITFSVETPHCTSGCGGVFPGPYALHIDVFKDNSLLAYSNTTIKLTN